MTTSIYRCCSHSLRAGLQSKRLCQSNNSLLSLVTTFRCCSFSWHWENSSQTMGFVWFYHPCAPTSPPNPRTRSKLPSAVHHCNQLAWVLTFCPRHTPRNKPISGISPWARTATWGLSPPPCCPGQSWRRSKAGGSELSQFQSLAPGSFSHAIGGRDDMAHRDAL